MEKQQIITNFKKEYEVLASFKKAYRAADHDDKAQLISSIIACVSESPMAKLGLSSVEAFSTWVIEQVYHNSLHEQSSGSFLTALLDDDGIWNIYYDAYSDQIDEDELDDLRTECLHAMPSPYTK